MSGSIRTETANPPLRILFTPNSPRASVAGGDAAARAPTGLHLDKNFHDRAPAAELALPTWEHYALLLVCAGAVGDASPKVTFPIRGFWMEGAFTKRSVQLD